MQGVEGGREGCGEWVVMCVEPENRLLLGVCLPGCAFAVRFGVRLSDVTPLGEEDLGNFATATAEASVFDASIPEAMCRALVWPEPVRLLRPGLMQFSGSIHACPAWRSAALYANNMLPLAALEFAVSKEKEGSGERLLRAGVAGGGVCATGKLPSGCREADWDLGRAFCALSSADSMACSTGFIGVGAGGLSPCMLRL